MKLHVLLAAAALLGAFLPHDECASSDRSGVYLASLEPQAQTVARAGENSFQRALQLQLTRGLVRGHVAQVRHEQRERRTEDAPISLDLTFHLLREVLQMARAERLAQQASSNRRMMDIFGK